MKFWMSAPREMSRLKKKLLLYFILIAVVSISVSAEIILEMSSPVLQNTIKANVMQLVGKQLHGDELDTFRKSLENDLVFAPIYSLRNRMLLLLIVVSLSIISAFYLFTKDIVAPMDKMVEATKRIAEGDLTVTVPIMSEDEIGQVAGLINDMNINLQDMIMQIRQEINRHMEQIIKASFKMSEVLKEDLNDSVLEQRRMKLSDFKKIQKFGREVLAILETMSDELYALQKFVKMYKIYGVHTEVSQDEISQAFDNYSTDDAIDIMGSEE